MNGEHDWIEWTPDDAREPSMWEGWPYAAAALGLASLMALVGVGAIYAADAIWFGVAEDELRRIAE